MINMMLIFSATLLKDSELFVLLKNDGRKCRVIQFCQFFLIEHPIA